MFDVNKFQAGLDKCLEHLNLDLSQIRTGRATSELVEDIKINAYDTVMTLKSLGNITVADSKSIVVQPWDKTVIEAIVKGIGAANLGFLAVTEGEIVRIKIPEMTEERRKEYVKIMKDKIEHARISVRNVRQEAMKEIDSLVENGLSEDDGKRHKEEVEKRVKAMNEKIAQAGEQKEKELMTI